MKFCKTLQRAVEISDPSYVPYWTNYKRLKKLIKAISTTSRESAKSEAPKHREEFHKPQHACNQQSSVERRRAEAPSSSSLTSFSHSQTETAESAIPDEVFGESLDRNEKEGPRSSTRPSSDTRDEYTTETSLFQQRKAELISNPREVAFFELLHAEFSKASTFFDKAQQEFIIREQLVSVGMQVLQCPQTAPRPAKHRWRLLTKAVFLLYRDLLLLEVFAIMEYFAFSKILKKHDKVTGYQTRGAFMVNVVHKANLTTYPKILEMITRCQELYDDASKRLHVLCLYNEEERLFLHMISEWNSRLRQPSMRAPLAGAAYGQDGGTGCLDMPEAVTSAAAAAVFRENTDDAEGDDDDDEASSLRAVIEDYREQSCTTTRDKERVDDACRILFPAYPIFRSHPSTAAKKDDESGDQKPAPKKRRVSGDSNKDNE